MSVRILLVDDHELVRKGIKATLAENKGWEVCGEAENGQEAFEKALQLRPDLIILDLSMPKVNGIQAAKLIREASLKTKILILSMHDSVVLVNDAKMAGADACLSKTCTTQELCSTIAALCDNHAALSGSSAKHQN